MDFNKYKNTYTYPSKSTIKKELIEKYDPENQKLTRSEYEELLSDIESEAESIYRKHRDNYHKQERKLTGEFFNDLAVELGYSHLPKELIELINGEAWDKGHSYGYNEVYIHAENVAIMVENIYNLGVEHGRNI